MFTDFSSCTIPQLRDREMIAQLSFNAHRRETSLTVAGAQRERCMPAFTW